MLFEHKNHEVYTVNKCKIALNRDDDKRIIQEDGITTLARGFAYELYLDKCEEISENLRVLWKQSLNK